MSAIEAIFENGVFRPTQPVALREGSKVEVLLPDEPLTDDPSAVTASSPVQSPKRPPMFGSAKGVYILSPDFDEPLADFEEYM